MAQVYTLNVRGRLRCCYNLQYQDGYDLSTEKYHLELNCAYCDKTFDAKVGRYIFCWDSSAEIPNFDAHELGILREYGIILHTCDDIHYLKRCAQCKNNILIQVVLGYGKPLVCDFPPRKMKTAPMMKFFISGAIPMSYYPDDTSWQVNRYIVNATGVHEQNHYGFHHETAVFKLLRGEHDEDEEEDSEEEEESSSKKPKLVQTESDESDKDREEKGEEEEEETSDSNEDEAVQPLEYDETDDEGEGEGEEEEEQEGEGEQPDEEGAALEEGIATYFYSEAPRGRRDANSSHIEVLDVQFYFTS